ncbi:MAG: alpha/beta hydrolase [Sphingomonadales bacterium]|nr:alpha/beta hydrolase [Sphingomonadales bacterium]MDE2169152.1 alpha/beta hydrolase [Sphingomonadales bacterium]
MSMIETKDGTRLYAKAWGQGRPVVLIHGWPLSSDSWDPIANRLADAGFQAIAYDRRGFGRSDQPTDGYDYDTFADDLSCVMDHFDVTRDAALVGFSMGGGEVARYMSRHDGRGVTQVALISSVVPFMPRDLSNPDGVPPDMFDEMERGILADRAHFFSGFFKQFFGVGLLERPVSAEVLDHMRALAMQAGLRPTLMAARAFANTDFRGDLPSLSVPTLVVHGTADKTVPIAATAHQVVRRVPRATLVEYDGEPHGVFATQTRRLGNDLIAFLDGNLAAVEQVDRQQAIDEMTARMVVAPTL